MTLLDVHEAWAWFVVIGNGLAGLWALAAHRWAALRSRALWWFVGVAEVSIFVQVGLGVALVGAEDLEPPSSTCSTASSPSSPSASSTATGRSWPGHRYLLYGLGSLFLMGLGIRAMLVGAT